jgi:hypothetical protein
MPSSSQAEKYNSNAKTFVKESDFYSNKLTDMIAFARDKECIMR